MYLKPVLNQIKTNKFQQEKKKINTNQKQPKNKPKEPGRDSQNSEFRNFQKFKFKILLYLKTVSR